MARTVREKPSLHLGQIASQRQKEATAAASALLDDLLVDPPAPKAKKPTKYRILYTPNAERAAALEQHLFSDFEQKVPYGAYQAFFDKLIDIAILGKVPT